MFRLLKSHYRFAFVSLFALAFALVLWTGAPLARAQGESQSSVPALDGHVNDFAAIIETETDKRLEAMLTGLKEQAGIDVAVVTVKTTGGEDVSDYSLKVAREWGINARTGGRKKALLLLVSMDDRKSFAQLDKALAAVLPDGLIGEMNSRMRAPLSAGKFSEGLMTAVQTIVSTLAVQRGLIIEGMDEKYAYNVTRPTSTRVESAPTVETAREANAEKKETTPTTSRKRKAASRTIATPAPKDAEPVAQTDAPIKQSDAPATNNAAPVSDTSTAATEKETPVVRKSSRAKKGTAGPGKRTARTEKNPTNAKAKTDINAGTDADVKNDANVRNDAGKIDPNAKVEADTKADVNAGEATAKASEATPKESASVTAGDDADKSELNDALALAPAERITRLKAFIEAHPASALKGRAAELIVSARAALGDEKLKAGDVAGGTEQFRLAITESPASMSDKLFAEVVSEIPLNLFVRGERAASVETAHLVEDKVKDDPKRLLAVADFYLSIEDAEDAARIAEMSVKLAPEMAAAHLALGAARRIALRLDDAATEYARALELEPKATSARRSLADLRRATGKPEEALALYREQLKADATDKGARAGEVLSLFDLGKKAEAETSLEAALKDDPRNLSLLVGAAYWYAAHGDGARGLELAQQAASFEPRYTWAHIAMARSLVQLNRPLDAERSLRYARQYGHFPTLNYELANVLAATGLYEEALEELSRSFALKDGEIQAQLAGRNQAHASDFIELLAPERRASIFQPVAADSPNNARMLKGLLALGFALNPQGERDAIKEAEVVAAIKDFTAGEDNMRAYRQLYAASRLVQRGVALPLVLELTEAATGGIEAALTASTSTIAVQADELRSIRAQAIASGGTPNVAEAPRNVLSNILRGRLEDLAGLALFNQDKTSEALVRLRRAVSVLPEGTPSSQAALWHLGTALAASGNQQEALTYYYKSYKSSGPDPVRRAVIEALYRKANGSLDGLDEKIGPASPATSNTSNSAPVPSQTPAPSPTP
ncbi:MAG TPA: TPM domain-containing protein [Pyrinomonadaceae bacterium]|nr:TPM domain-containing protein [Pyrinomonadaceae bacterium]